MANRTKLSWQPIEVEKFSTAEGKKLWANHVAAKVALEKFAADQLTKAGLIPEGQSAKFGYQYGGMAFALVPTDKPDGRKRDRVVI